MMWRVEGEVGSGRGKWEGKGGAPLGQRSDEGKNWEERKLIRVIV